MDGGTLTESVDEQENERRDALAEGLMGLLKPAVEEVDERVSAVRLLSSLLASSSAQFYRHCTLGLTFSISGQSCWPESNEYPLE